MENLYKHDCKDELRELDLRATPARLAILGLLEKTHQPLDVQTMIDFLDRKLIKTNPATVFRIMHIFSEKGLVKTIQLAEGKFRYELSSLPDHHHFVCESCGDIDDISDCNIHTLEKEISQKKGFTINHHALEFYGLCVDCLKKQQ